MGRVYRACTYSPCKHRHMTAAEGYTDYAHKNKRKFSGFQALPRQMHAEAWSHKLRAAGHPATSICRNMSTTTCSVPSKKSTHVLAGAEETSEDARDWRQLPPSQLCSIANVLLDRGSTTWLRGWLAICQSQLHQFSMNELTQFILVLVRLRQASPASLLVDLRQGPAGLFGELGQAVLSRAPDASITHLSHCAWGMAVLEQRPGAAWCQAIAQHALAATTSDSTAATSHEAAAAATHASAAAEDIDVPCTQEEDCSGVPGSAPAATTLTVPSAGICRTSSAATSPEASVGIHLRRAVALGGGGAAIITSAASGSISTTRPRVAPSSSAVIACTSAVAAAPSGPVVHAVGAATRTTVPVSPTQRVKAAESAAAKDAADWARLLWALSRLGLQPTPALAASLAAATLHVVPASTATQLVTLLAALARLGLAADHLRPFVAATLKFLEVMEEGALVECVEALLRCSPVLDPGREWVEELDRVAFNTLQDMSPEVLARLACCRVMLGCAVGRPPEPDLVALLMEASGPAVSELEPGLLVQLGTALAALRVRPDAAWSGLFLKYSGIELAGMEPQQLVDVIAAVDGLQIAATRGWLVAFVSAAESKLPAMSAAQTAAIVGALHKLGAAGSSQTVARFLDKAAAVQQQKPQRGAAGRAGQSTGSASSSARSRQRPRRATKGPT